MVTKTRLHRFASRLHKWLALFAGVQIILWFASGAYMSFMPIEQVRGEHLIDRHAAKPLPTQPDLSGLPRLWCSTQIQVWSNSCRPTVKALHCCISDTTRRCELILRPVKSCRR